MLRHASKLPVQLEQCLSTKSTATIELHKKTTCVESSFEGGSIADTVYFYRMHNYNQPLLYSKTILIPGQTIMLLWTTI